MNYSLKDRRLTVSLVMFALVTVSLTVWLGSRSVAQAEPAEDETTTVPFSVLLSEIDALLSPDPLPAGSPIGSWDLTTTGNSVFRVSGWALDPDTDEAVTIRATAGDVTVEETTGQPRPEIQGLYPYYGENTGFFFAINVDPGEYELCLTIVNIGEGEDTSLGCHNVMTRDSVGAQGVGLRDGEQPYAGEGTFTTTTLRTENNPDADTNFPLAIKVEDGLRADVDEWAAYALEILNDPRGWINEGYYFTSNPDEATFTLILASPATVDRLCSPLPTGGFTSCQWGINTVINVDRWAEASPAFLNAGGEINDYRDYVINHEIGHAIGYGAHDVCPAPGELAPIMQQQTLDMEGCLPNGWPYPND